MGLVN